MKYCFLGSVLLLVSCLFATTVLANTNLKLSIQSPDACTFGDTDLILRDFVKDYALKYKSSKLLLEIRDDAAAKVVRREILVDLSEEDRDKDAFSKVIEKELKLEVQNLPDSTYSILLCKIGAGIAKDCSAINPQSFDDNFKEFTEVALDTKQINKLYFFQPFKISGGKVQLFSSKEDPRSVVGSVPLQEVGSELLVQLPKNEPSKCGLYE